MLPIVETITNFITPVLAIIRNAINYLPWEPEINYIVIAAIGGYFISRASEFMQPWKIGLLGGALIYVILMFI